MLHFQKQNDTSALRGFSCGVQKMDWFIRRELESVIKDSRYSLYVVRVECGVVVAMFVISEGQVLQDKDCFREIEQDGSPFAAFREGEIFDKVCFQTLEIDYLAVKKEVRGKGIGTCIVAQLAELAKSQKRHFITVDAFQENGYSAIPFYEKNGFLAVEDYSEEKDTLRMFRFVDQ